VSYDVSRELYKDINPAFAARWQRSAGEKLTVNQSHGGSSKQVGSVVAGLEADVVTMNQAPDIEMLAKSGLVSADWRKAFPHGAAPYTSTTIFLVRKGNPKGIKDWSDLIRPGLQVIVPNPKTSGNGRYTYLAAWGYALQKTGNDAGARDFVSKLFANVPVLDGGGRGATTTFTQRDIGDVLITFENEATLIDQEVGGDKFDVVYPSLSIEAAAPVAVVEGGGQARHPQGAEAYLNSCSRRKGRRSSPGIISAPVIRPCSRSTPAVSRR
jgi:sulfate transport system substrate-binding protein